MIIEMVNIDLDSSYFYMSINIRDSSGRNRSYSLGLNEYNVSEQIRYQLGLTRLTVGEVADIIIFVKNEINNYKQNTTGS